METNQQEDEMSSMSTVRKIVQPIDSYNFFFFGK